jgi:hypothetical protein
VAAIHLVNFAHGWWPRYVVRIPTQFDFSSLLGLFPTFSKGRLAWCLSQCRIYFTVIGIAYLVSADVSLSFAIVPYIGTFVTGVLAGYGVSFMGGGEHRASIYTSLSLGSFFAFVAMVLYFGRRHYWNVLRGAFGLRGTDPPRPHEIWGARAFLLCTLASTGLMIGYGLAWPYAIVYMISIIVFYVAVSRVVAETGLYLMKPAWVPHIMLLGMFGGFAVGPTAAVISMILSAVLFAEARESVMPNMVNSFNLLSREKVKFGRVAAWSAAAITLGLIAGLVTMLYLQHDRGTDMAAGGWFTRTVPSYPFHISADMAQRLKSQGRLEESDALPAWKRPFVARPERKFAISFIVGVALVVGAYIGRLRVRGWPVHPAILLLWSWYHCAKLAFAFFVGWTIKTLVTRYGGWKTVQRVKPIMIGLIAGDMLGAFVPAIISALYYFVSGELPPRYSVLP